MKQKILPFWDGVSKGAKLFIFLYIVWLLGVFLKTKFLDSTEWLRITIVYLFDLEALVSSLSLRNYLSIVISIFVFFPGLWLLGHVPLNAVEDYIGSIWRKVFTKKKERKFLFCIKMKDKSFFGGYPIGFVTQIGTKENGEIYYHTWWPGLLHLTLPFVPPEDVEVCDTPRKEVLKIYLSGGAL